MAPFLSLADLHAADAGPRATEVERARARLLACLDDVLRSVDLMPVGSPGYCNDHPVAALARATAAERAFRQEARAARAPASAPDAPLILDALRSALARGFAVRGVPRLLGRRLGRVPGAPTTWAAMAEAAGLERETSAERWRWRLRQARAALREAEAPVFTQCSLRLRAPTTATVQTGPNAP